MASGFICYDSYLRKTRNLTDEALGKLFRALMSYHLTGEIPEMDELVSAVFDFLREDLDDGDEKYQARCEINRQNRLAAKKSVPRDDTRAEASRAADPQTRDDASMDGSGANTSKAADPQVRGSASEDDPGADTSKTSDPPVEDDASVDDDREPSLTVVDDRTQNKNQKAKIEKENKNIKPKTKDTPPVSPPRGTGLTPLEGFEEFYGEFPLHVSKQDAIRAWNKLRPDESLRGEIMSALEKQKKSDQWRREGGRYIPHPATWLNGRRWEDEAVQPVPDYGPRQAHAPVWSTFSSHQYSQRDYSEPEETIDEIMDRFLAEDAKKGR